jgi:hypothetical protein
MELMRDAGWIDDLVQNIELASVPHFGEKPVDNLRRTHRRARRVDGSAS